jgi:hypothetical protein
MFRKPVVFIVGAGASKEYGLPSGGELASTIATAVNELNAPTRRDTSLFDLLISAYGPDAMAKYLDAGKKLAAAISSAASIDDALHRLSDFPEAVELGKICIIKSILETEARSSLQLREGRLQLDTGKDGWIEYLFSIAIENKKLSEVPHAFDNVTFINFNYDRCLEHYLFWSLQRIGLNEQDAANTVAGLSMIRPYGTIGSILPTAPDFWQFGNTDFRRDLRDTMSRISRIRTYTESEALHDPGKVRDVMTQAAMYIFLGFGFHPSNLDLISVATATPVTNPLLLATVKGVHEENLGELKLSLQNRLKVYDGYVGLIRDMTASQLLSQLRLRISLLVG